MKKTRKTELYQIKNIYFGYITTINPDALNIEDRFKKEVIALKKTKNEKGASIFVPLKGNLKYYTNIKLVPLSNILKKSGIITSSELQRVIQIEKKNTITNIDNSNYLRLENENTNQKHKDITLIKTN